MKKIFASTALLFALAGVAFSSDIGDIVWTQSNVQRLNHLTKAEVVTFLNQTGEVTDSPAAITESEISQFQWVDLVGDGKLELALIARSGPCCSALDLYWQNAPGKIRGEAFVNAGDLKGTIRDLNGDGKKELILYSYLTSDGYRGGVHPAAMWPRVYRLEGGKYVEASRDFPDFYDQEVMPQLTQRIAEIQRRQRTASSGDAVVAALEMERDKILRMLGRDPTAGLAQAREWGKSDNPELIEDAAVVFRDIGGNDDDARAADAALKRALAQQASTKGGT